MRQVATWVLAGVMTLGCGGGDGDKDPIRVGLLAPLSGRADFVGESFERVAETAIITINDNGGVDGHPLVLVKRDTNSLETDALSGFIELVEDEGVVAIVGPALSDSVSAVYVKAAELGVPFISPSSTAASLIDAVDGGYMFRNVPNDNFQGRAQARFLTQSSSGPMIDTVAVLHENSGYGDGLAQSFKAEFEQCGDSNDCVVPDGSVVPFEKGVNTPDKADDVLDALAAVTPEPSWVMVVALVEDAIRIFNAWDTGGGPMDHLPDVQWFMTDGVRLAEFLDRIPASMVDMMGTAPTIPTSGDAYGVLAQAYQARNTDNLDDQVFAANVWDAYYLIAAGLAAQLGEGEALGGAGLRDQLYKVSAGPGQIFHAGQWPEMVAALRGGAEVDYDGASGPNDFDDNGETIGPYEVWKISEVTPGNYTFEQVLFIPASDLAD